jgi:hypothetical protein
MSQATVYHSYNSSSRWMNRTYEASQTEGKTKRLSKMAGYEI